MLWTNEYLPCIRTKEHLPDVRTEQQAPARSVVHILYKLLFTSSSIFDFGEQDDTNMCQTYVSMGAFHGTLVQPPER